MFDAAIATGYRHFDTAQAYNNEHLLGAAIKRHGLKREELFITTKIFQHQGYHRAKRAFAESLEKLQTDYVDLLLIHFPVPLLRRGTWRAMEEFQQAGQVKSLGVSNYMVRHLKSMEKYATVMPAVNQFELHVFLQQPKLVEYCRENNIVVEAYSPMAHGLKQDNPVIQKIADKHGKSYAQIMLRWCLQQPAVVLPKSVTPSRIAENINIVDFELDANDMAELKREDRNLRTCAPTKPAYFIP